MERIVVASGYFNPLHSGHIEYLERSKLCGDKLIVIVNTDRQSLLKKGESFLNEVERLKMIRALRCVDFALLSCDEDRTVRKTLRLLYPDVFANGGDVSNETVPEKEVCEELGITMIHGLGDKITSSTEILQKYKNHLLS